MRKLKAVVGELDLGGENIKGYINLLRRPGHVD